MVPPLEPDERGHEAACWELERVAPLEAVRAANAASEETP